MDFKGQQNIFDDIKWYDSILAGYDRCGSYEFCINCDKQEPEPCARAAFRHQRPKQWAEALVAEELCVAESVEETRPLIPIVKIRLKMKKVEK